MRIVLLFLSVLVVGGVHAAELSVTIDYIEQQVKRRPVLSRLVTWPKDEGRPGARLAMSDNSTTGRFLKHKYTLNENIIARDEHALETIRTILSRGPIIAVLNLPAKLLLQVIDLPEARDDLLINASAADDRFRAEDCRSNLLHTLPSYTMLSDALMQFLVYRRWTKLLMIEGPRPADALFASALRASIGKFKLKLILQRKWISDADLRRNAAREVPVLTQASEYDVVLVADEDHDFGQYVLYNTWLPRPVGGSVGMRPVAWAPVLEQWGAVQLQSRFKKISRRPMTSRDYAVWLAVRSIGEAVTRTKSNKVAELLSYLTSKDFALAGFKGTKLSFRNWDGQMRQPIPLVHAKSLIAMAPIAGFLHQTSELDTLGVDRPQTKCPNPVGGMK